MKPGHKFTVIDEGVTFKFEAAEEGGYVVNVPAAPGCWSEGDTFEEALDMIKDALVGWAQVAEEKGIPAADKVRGFVTTRVAAST